MDQGLDRQVKADEKENSIGPTDEHRELFVETSIQKTAVNMEWMQAVLGRKKFCHHALIPNETVISSHV